MTRRSISVAVGLEGYRQLGRDRGHAHYLGGAVLLWVCWLTAIGVGAAAGGGLPAWLHLEFVIPLYLTGQAISKLADPALRRAIFVAAAVALLALTAPLQLGIALAIAAGVAAGLTGRPAGPTRSDPPASAIHGDTAMNAWTVILAAGLGSFLFRLSMIVLFGRITMPAYLQRALELVAPAAFAAMAAAGVADGLPGPGYRPGRGAAGCGFGGHHRRPAHRLAPGRDPGRDARWDCDRPATELTYRIAVSPWHGPAP